MTIKKIFIYINIILFFNLFSITHLYANEEAKGIVKERMIKFKASKTLMKKINKGLQNQNFRVIENSAEALLIWGKEMSKYFPEGSDNSPSKASSDIWNDPEGFKQAINNFQLASLELITQSKTNDMDQVISSFRSLAGTCKGCHEKFKN